MLSKRMLAKALEAANIGIDLLCSVARTPEEIADRLKRREREDALWADVKNHRGKRNSCTRRSRSARTGAG